MKLPAISNDKKFSLLALDQVSTIAEVCHLNPNDRDDSLMLELLIRDLAEIYSAGASGVIFSPEAGYQALYDKAASTGPIFCLEQQLEEQDPLSVPILVPQWGVEAVANNYGVAKLQLYYNPREEEAATKKQMLVELYDYCQHEGIDLLLDLVVYVEGTEKEYKEIFQNLQLQAIQDLRKHCDLIAIEYPQDAIGAVTVTAELDVPWILSLHDSQYDNAKENLRTCLESGAVGFMGIQQFLPSLSKNQSFERQVVREFLKTTGRDRMIELTRIVDETSID